MEQVSIYHYELRIPTAIRSGTEVKTSGHLGHSTLSDASLRRLNQPNA